MVYHFIDYNKDYFGLRWLCRHFGISTNGYYNYLKNNKHDYHEQREVIYERIKYIFYNSNRTVGHRAMRVFLSRYGIYLSKTTIHKYMNKTLNLAAIIMSRKPGYTAGKKHKIFDNLLKRNFNVNEKNKVWCTDFTYMRQPNGKFRYNCTIIDLYDRSVVASVNDDFINTELAITTLKEALKHEKYPKGLILHSDQGQPFASWDFVMFCKSRGITQSMSKAGCPYDNAPMERFFNTFKSCFYHRFTFKSVEMLDEMTKQYINWYNYVRPHSVGKVFDDGYIPVVVGIGVVFGSGADFLQGVNHNEPAFRKRLEVFLKLPHKTVRELAACHGEMEMFACFIGQLKKPVLYAVKGILQTEIQFGNFLSR